MAYLVRRNADRVEIRESRATPRGPRSCTLASFSGPLTPDALERAASRATRPFDAGRLVRRARATGIAVASRSREPEARALLARLHRGDPIDPVLAGLLQRALAAVATAPAPEAIADVSDWVGTSAAERGAALRDLLDTYGRIAASRPPRRERPRSFFPRFSSAGTTSSA
jgi:hypothetical protein